MAVIDELLVGLGFDYDPDDLDQFKSDLNKTTSIIKNLAAVALAGAAAITGIAIASTAASDEQGKLADEIGDSVENITALEFALNRAGGKSGAMTQSLRRLANVAGEAARGVGEGAEVFKLLGINVNDAEGGVKKSSDLMLEVAKSFEGLSKTEQISFANKLGLRGSIRLLQQGSDEIKNLTDEAAALGLTTAEDAKLAADFQDSLTDLASISKQIARLFSRVFVPALESTINLFTEWWKANRQIIEQNLPSWIERLTAIFKVLITITAIWIGLRLANHLFQLVALMRGLGVATIFATAAAALLPALIIAGATALVLLAEDAKVFFEGGESFIGDMIEKFPQWADEITIVASVFSVLADWVTRVWDGLKGIAGIISNLSLEGLKDFVSNIPGFAGDITGLANVGGGGIISDVGQSISNTASTTVDKIEILIQGGADTAENIANEVANVFQQTAQDLNSAVSQ